ncbi:hypothetical protein N7468_001441 [Penicillium chermesinum]|uniref:Pyridoxamine 5'-phosphate oxidase Alr4036 family FMN-binding domain-containing protein n=1 Tax=Penicillium chermesinum TaxID=63820 RepID=A0A9W9TXC7_9EURO|nr:uncharacterized protein N7468_001441 [Penicillium chermesinum]KAJ5246458.1 hypothetical protein N7468_001441 [Penicillium chermesinum]KAJ6144733.1 hypothetical protein N7470_008628 [Penicillium chermesinum]
MLSSTVGNKALNPLRVASTRLQATRLLIEGSPAKVSTFSTMGLPGDKPRHAQAPWREQLSSHLDRTQVYEFTIATIGYDSKGRPVPRVRTCGCRGFFPELELHPSGQKDMDEQVEDGGNPPVYESDLLTFTTDIRMEKLHQLDASGNAVEAVFWLKDLMIQWRIKGTALSIGNPSVDSKEQEHRKALGDWLRPKEGAGDIQKWTWEKAVTKYFANHSPVMRGSFKSPPPGQPRSKIPDNPELQLGQKVTDLHDPIARENFRVVAIVPEEAEYLDLSNADDVRRWKWDFQAAGSEGNSTGRWNESELWP